MKSTVFTRLVQALSVCGLGLVLLPSLFFFCELVSLEDLQALMLVGTLLWFGISIFLRFTQKA